MFPSYRSLIQLSLWHRWRRRWRRRCSSVVWECGSCLFVISSASSCEGFLLLDVVGCYCCCWCWWWWHRQRTRRRSERNNKHSKVGTQQETDNPNTQKWIRKSEQISKQNARNVEGKENQHKTWDEKTYPGYHRNGNGKINFTIPYTNRKWTWKLRISRLYGLLMFFFLQGAFFGFKVFVFQG